MDAWAQEDAGLSRKNEGPSKILNCGLGRAIKEDEGCGLRFVWEVGQSSGVAEKDSVPD